MKKSRFWPAYLALSLVLLAACQSETSEQQDATATPDTVEQQVSAAPASKRDLSYWAGDYRPAAPVEGQGKKMGIRTTEEGLFIEIVLVDGKQDCNKRLKVAASEVQGEERHIITEGECPLELRYKDGLVEIQEIETCFTGKSDVCSFSGTYEKQ